MKLNLKPLFKNIIKAKTITLIAKAWLFLKKKEKLMQVCAFPVCIFIQANCWKILQLASGITVSIAAFQKQNQVSVGVTQWVDKINL